MNKKKILFLFGTRPEAIKLAPVIRAFRDNRSFEVVCCSTGQHTELLDHVVTFFEIPVDHSLKVMKPNQTLSDLTACLVKAIDAMMQSVIPDLVVVHGDTTTSFCGALVGFYNRKPVAHVEAGLRTGNKFSPYPEEMNRTFNGYLADIHFAPTETAVANLARVGIHKNVILTGNTVIDALKFGLEKLNETNFSPSWRNKIDRTKRLILVTQHRRENFGHGIASILQALQKLAGRGDVQILFPVHLNPNVRNPIFNMLGSHPHILLLEPLPYVELLWCMNQCEFIITDSGGIQEEAPAMRKPFLVTREFTERPEAIDCGAGFLVGTDHERIIELAERLLIDMNFYQSCTRLKNPYGDGKASERILNFISTRYWNAKT